MENTSKEEVDLLRQNARSMVRELGLLNDAYFNIGVTLAERHLLIELTHCQCPTVGEIAERLLLDKSTVSRLISKAVKKGYIKYSSDKNDKRKRFLEFTSKGQEILNQFEPIAFNQTKDALETLTKDEIETVYRGIALYAQGLKNSRMQKQIMESLIKINKEQEFKLDFFKSEDENQLYDIFKSVVDSGFQFPYKCNSLKEFHRQFINAESQVYVCHSSSGEVIGGFYIRENFPGQSNQIANAAYMVRERFRGRGIGTHLVKASLTIAKELGFTAMQFNRVLKENISAIKLYQKLGFNIIHTLPESQDGYIMFRKL